MPGNSIYLSVVEEAIYVKKYFLCLYELPTLSKAEMPV
jgi:hypothetical protein